ncbi:MAG: hypothetical protein J6D57_05040 [Mogibacterium sp.]|nr:hypothetical protein [Mogibacterium sp.]
MKKRRRRLPNDFLILIIIAELFAVSFSCTEIVTESTERTIDRRTAAITETSTSYLIDPTEAVAKGKEAYDIWWEEEHRWKGPVLSKGRGVNYGPSGKETYYNLNMSTVVSIMRSMGYTGEYWVRDDGCKMLGDYIMVAANLNLRPRGSIVETSLGDAIVCDTGGFAKRNPTQIDIAVTW